MELDVYLTAGLVDELERVNAEARHVSVVERDADIIEQKREHVARLWVVAEKVPDAPPLLEMATGIRLQRVDHVRELDAVANEEHGEVVADQVVVTLARVEFHGEAAGVAEGLWRAALVNDCREADGNGRLDAGRAQEVSACQARDVMRDLQQK